MFAEFDLVPVDDPNFAKDLMWELAREHPDMLDAETDWLLDPTMFNDPDIRRAWRAMDDSWRRTEFFNLHWFKTHRFQRQASYPIPRSEEPKLDPDWTKESPDGEIFAADLFAEGRELLDAGLEQLRGAMAEDDVMAARAQFEGAREILARIVPQEAADRASEAESLVALGLEYLGDGDDDNAVLLFESARDLMSDLPSRLAPG